MEMLEMQHTFEVVLVANGNFFGSQCILMITYLNLKTEIFDFGEL